MAQSPNFLDFEFLSASIFQNAANQGVASIEDLDATAFLSGIMLPPSSSINCTLNSNPLILQVQFGTQSRVLFNNGVLAGGFGNQNNLLNGTYTADFTSLVPGSGSVTAYCVATASTIGQNAIVVPGPTPGHPDFDPLFAPYQGFSETLDTLVLSATLTVPDNVTHIEIARVTLTAGSGTISNIRTTSRPLALPIGAPITATDLGAAGAMAVTVSPSALPLSIGTILVVKAAATNTGATTMTVNGGTAIPIVSTKYGGTPSALPAGAIQVGLVAILVFDGTNLDLMTDWTNIFSRANTWSALQTFSAGMLLGNNQHLSGNTTAGISEPMLTYGVDNNVYAFAGTGGEFYIYNAAASVRLFSADSGGVAIPGTINVGGVATFGTTVNVNGSVGVQTTITANGQISGGSSRITTGATGTGDGLRVTNLNDFFGSASLQSFPNGWLKQVGIGIITATGAGLSATLLNLPVAFPNACAWCNGNFGGTTPPTAGLAFQPSGSPAQILVTINAPSAGSWGIVFEAWGN